MICRMGYSLIESFGLEGTSKDVQTKAITAWIQQSNPSWYTPSLKDHLTQEGFGDLIEQVEREREERLRAEELAWLAEADRAPEEIGSPMYGEYARHWRSVTSALTQELTEDEWLPFSVRNRIANLSWRLLRAETAQFRSKS